MIVIILSVSQVHAMVCEIIYPALAIINVTGLIVRRKFGTFVQTDLDA